jgi:O-antigen/teichoic acid export membrane protein
MSGTDGSRRATTWVVAGSAVSGVAAYGFQLVGARALGEQAYAPIGVLWTLQYLAFAVPLISVESYLTRLRARALHQPSALRGPLLRTCAWVAVMAVVVGAVTWRWRDALYAGDAQLAVVAAVIVAAYGAFAVVRGLLAGAERFRLYAVGTGAESLLRLLLVVPVVWLVGTTAGVAWTMPVGPLLVLSWWLRDRRRAVTRRCSGAPPCASAVRRSPPVRAVRARGGSSARR